MGKFFQELFQDNPHSCLKAAPTESLFQCDKDFIFFNSVEALPLGTTFTQKFDLTNISKKKISIELYIAGFKEPHEILFNPNFCIKITPACCTVKIDADETQTIEVSIRFACTAKLTPSKARICGGIANEWCFCDLLGIEATSELPPYISCDDIKRRREIGSGTYYFYSLF